MYKEFEIDGVKYFYCTIGQKVVCPDTLELVGATEGVYEVSGVKLDEQTVLGLVQE